MLHFVQYLPQQFDPLLSVQESSPHMDIAKVERQEGRNLLFEQFFSEFPL